MKKIILPIAILFSGTCLLQSCEKPNENKNVTLNETISSGNIYSLDMSAYSDRNSSASIVTQAADFKTSQIDYDAATSRNIYHFSADTKTTEQEKVVIDVSKHGNTRCSHDDSKTVITINFTVSQ